MPTNYCCLNRICGGFAMWQLGWLKSTSQNSLSYMFLVREGPNRDSKGDLQSASQLQVFCSSHPLLLIRWLTGWREVVTRPAMALPAAGSSSGFSDPRARCVCLALGQALAFIGYSLPRSETKPYRMLVQPHGLTSVHPMGSSSFFSPPL